MELKDYITPVAVNEGLDEGTLHKNDDIVKAAVTQVAAYDYFYNGSDDTSDDSSTDTLENVAVTLKAPVDEVLVDEAVDEVPVDTLVDNSDNSSDDAV